ncbi:hypothetical protein GCM10010103_79000 [Streptomyces paradoxus]
MTVTAQNNWIRKVPLVSRPAPRSHGPHRPSMVGCVMGAQQAAGAKAAVLFSIARESLR